MYIVYMYISGLYRLVDILAHFNLYGFKNYGCVSDKYCTFFVRHIEVNNLAPDFVQLNKPMCNCIAYT